MCSKHYWLIINNRIHASSWCRFQVVENAQLNWLRPISSTALVLVRRTSAHDCLFIYEHELMQSTFDIYNEKSWFMKSFAHILFALKRGRRPRYIATDFGRLSTKVLVLSPLSSHFLIEASKDPYLSDDWSSVARFRSVITRLDAYLIRFAFRRVRGLRKIQGKEINILPRFK